MAVDVARARLRLLAAPGDGTTGIAPSPAQPSETPVRHSHIGQCPDWRLGQTPIEQVVINGFVGEYL
jgi:hypothetical protein